MPQLKRHLLGVALLLGLCSEMTFAEPYALYVSDAGFADVMEGLTMAIEQRGMYINNVMNMGEMLERTGKDLGMESVLFGQAQSVEFCSAVLSREMISENPIQVVNCPFIIAVYTLPDDPNRTYLAYRQVSEEEQAASPAMAKVAEMLNGVAEAAIDW